MQIEQQQPTAEMSISDKLYIESRKALGKEPLTIEHFSFLGDDAQAFYSLHRITEVIKARKEGQKLNWDNSSEWKWSPWFDMRSGSGFAFRGSVDVCTYSRVGSRLASKTQEDSDLIAKAMEQDYKNWFAE